MDTYTDYMTSYAMFIGNDKDGWGQYGIMGERDAMAAWLHGRRRHLKDTVRAINLDNMQEATWEDYL